MPSSAYRLAAIAAITLAAPVAAQTSPSITGTWKGDVASAKLPTKPDIFAIKDGRYTCASCTPPIAVKADGSAQAVAGHDYWDHLTVRIVDPLTVAYTYARGGKTVSSSTDTVSADGKTLTTSWRSTDNAKGIEQSGTSTETRIGTAPAGAHAVSGSWQRAEIKQVSDSSLYMTFKDAGGALAFSQPSGETYIAKFGGPAAPIVGDPAGTVVKVRRVGARTIEETDLRGGKVVSVYTMTVAPDGKTMTVVTEDRKAGTKTQFVAYRQ